MNVEDRLKSETNDYRLPQGWQCASLSEITTPSKEKIDPSQSTGLVYVGLEHIEKGTGKLLDFGISDDVRSTKTKFHEGDLLYGKLRPYLNKVWLSDREGICSTDILVLQQNQYISNKFLHYRLLSHDFVLFSNQQASGIELPRVNYEKISSFEIALPPLSEQYHIVDKIEELFTQLDAGVAALDKVQTQLRRYRQAVLESACDGRLTRGWREAHPELDDATENLRLIREIREKSKKEVNPKDVGIPDDLLNNARAENLNKWTWCQLKDLAIVSLGGTPARKEARYWNGEIPWISSGEVANCRIKSTRECITSEGLANSNAKLYPKRTVLIAMIGEGKTRGQSAILDLEACTNQNVAGLVFDSEEVYPEFIWYWARANYNRTRNSGRGGEQPALNGRIIRGMRIHFPPFAEQCEIVKEIERLFSIADEIEDTIGNSLRKAESLRHSILKRAFQGKLVPQDPNDEPAAVLLERIRAEKAKQEPARKRAMKVKTTTQRRLIADGD